jgi:hypothetical protein
MLPELAKKKNFLLDSRPADSPLEVSDSSCSDPSSRQRGVPQ